MKSILDLCRQLPDSEPEIREREREFDETVRLATEPETYGRQYLRCISDAKAATDAMIAKGWQFDCGTVGYDADNWSAAFRRPRQGVDKPHKFDRECVAAAASTEELARSAACVLAAEAMKEKR